MSFEKYEEVTITLHNSVVDKIQELSQEYNYGTYLELMQKMVAFDAGYLYGKVENIIENPDYYLISDEMEGACSYLIGVGDNYIYEGDILKYGDNIFGIVIFDKGAFMYHEAGTARNEDITLFEFLNQEYDYEIVGNIRKNPELLK